MQVPLQYAYLCGDIVFLFIWFLFFLSYKHLRREMLIMSCLIGALSVLTAYYWWTVDWWHPMTITGSKVGIEDFLIGFASGGIMSIIYEGFFKKTYRINARLRPYSGGFAILLLLAFATSWLFWGVGLSSFWASTLAMLVTAAVLYYCRKDLFLNGIITGVLMIFIALFFYYTIEFISPDWVLTTYDFKHLSGIEVTGIPVEEFIFWFLAGLLFGPFYEYWRGEQLKKVPVRTRRK